MEKDNENELKAKQAVANYRTEIRMEMRQVARLLTDEQYKNMLGRERLMWEMATEPLKYSRNYQNFYRQYYESLENYKNSMLDYIARLTQ